MDSKTSRLSVESQEKAPSNTSRPAPHSPLDQPGSSKCAAAAAAATGQPEQTFSQQNWTEGGEPDKKTDSNSFWLPKNYKLVVHRVKLGYDHLMDLRNMFNERSLIEAKHGKSISDWMEKWESVFASNKKHNKLGLFHDKNQKNMLFELLKLEVLKAQSSVIFWRDSQQQCVHPVEQLIGSFYTLGAGLNAKPKIISDIEGDFKGAQKKWLETEAKIEKLHDAYLAVHQQFNLLNNKSDKTEKDVQKMAKLNKEMVDLQEKHAKLTAEVATRFKSEYVEAMEATFDKAQDLELRKLVLINSVISKFHQLSQIKHNLVFQIHRENMTKALSLMNPDAIVDEWRNKHGPPTKFKEMTIKALPSIPTESLAKTAAAGQHVVEHLKKNQHSLSTTEDSGVNENATPRCDQSCPQDQESGLSKDTFKEKKSDMDGGATKKTLVKDIMQKKNINRLSKLERIPPPPAFQDNS